MYHLSYFSRPSRMFQVAKNLSQNWRQDVRHDKTIWLSPSEPKTWFLRSLSFMSKPSKPNAGQIQWRCAMSFSALMTCLKVNVGNVRNTNVRERVTRTCLLQTPTMQYFSTLFMLFYERTMLRQLVKCITCHVCSIMQPFSKIFPKLVRWILCIQSLQIYHCLLAQWVDKSKHFWSLIRPKGLSRDHPEYRPIQQASCSRLRASCCQSGRVRAQEAADNVYYV
jgi:hypothetical protein